MITWISYSPRSGSNYMYLPLGTVIELQRKLALSSIGETNADFNYSAFDSTESPTLYLKP